MRYRIIAASLLIASLGVFAVAQNSGPGTGAAKGTWKLNVEKSDYGQQAKPKSMRLVVTEDTAASVKWSVSGVDGDGKPVNESFSGAIDGKPYPIKGDPQVNTIAYTSSGNDVHGDIKMKDGSSASETVSMSDHNTMTVKIEGNGPARFGTTEVWERVHAGQKAATKKAAK